MSFRIILSINDSLVYDIYGHRLTTNKTGLSEYNYNVVYRPLVSVYGPPKSIATISHPIFSGKIMHQYEDGLLVLCEKVVHKVNAEQKEGKENEMDKRETN